MLRLRTVYSAQTSVVNSAIKTSRKIVRRRVILKAFSSLPKVRMALQYRVRLLEPTPSSMAEPLKRHKYELVRGLDCSNSANGRYYTDITFRNHFKVSGGPILLTAVKFFGPVADESAEYYAKVRVETPAWTIRRQGWTGSWHVPFFHTKSRRHHKRFKLYGEKEMRVTAKKNQCWAVTFDEPIFIPPEEYIEIGFLIKGEIKCGFLDTNHEQMVFDADTAFGKRTFYFLGGSGQMCGFEFEVGPELNNLDTLSFA